MGERGPAGAPGSSTNAYRPLFWVSCFAALDLLNIDTAVISRGADGRAETALHYALMIYTNNDVEAQCSASAGALQSAAESLYYPSVTKGASSGLCDVNSDYPSSNPTTNDTVGFWSFEVSPNTSPNATYNDPDNPLGLNGYAYKFAEADCNANMLGDAGQWSHVTLSDVF